MSFIRLSSRRNTPVAVLVMVPMLIAIIMALSARDFFIFAVRANPWINISILVALAVGIVMVLRVARSLDYERGVLDTAMNALRNQARDTLDALPTSLNGRLFGRLCKLGLADAAMLPEGTIDAEIAVVRGELDRRQDPLHYVVGLMVALGLFGTFIGLLDTLVSAADVLSVVGKNRGADDMMGVFSQMINALRAPLVSMGTAFSASMFGLVGSIVMGLMVVLLSRQADVMLEQTRAALFSISDARRATLQPTAAVTDAFLARFLTDLAEQNRRASDLLTQILETTASALPAMHQVAGSVQLLAERMDRQSVALQDLPASMARLERTPTAIDEGNLQLARIHASLVTQEMTLAGLGAKLQTEGAGTAATLGELRTLLVSQLSSLRDMEAAQAPALASIERVAMNVARLEERAATQATAQLAEARSLREPLVEALQVMNAGLQKTGDAGAALASSVPAGIARLESSLTRINDRLAREEEALRAQSLLLRSGLESEAQRVGDNRLLIDAVLASASGMNGARQDMSGLLGAQRQVAGQLADVLKGLEIAVGSLQGVREGQQIAAQSRQAGLGERA